MTLPTIPPLIWVLLNISYTIALLIVCIKKRNVKTVKEKSEQHKPSELPRSSEANRKEPLGAAALPEVVVTKEAVIVTAADVPKQVQKQSANTANQMQQAVYTQSTQSSKERIASAKDGQKNLLQRIKNMKEKKNGQVQYEQYKSAKRRKKATGIKLKIAHTQRSNETEEQSKKDKEEEDEEEEDDTMKGIVSLQQDLNIVSAEE